MGGGGGVMFNKSTPDGKNKLCRRTKGCVHDFVLGSGGLLEVPAKNVDCL